MDRQIVIGTWFRHAGKIYKVRKVFVVFNKSLKEFQGWITFERPDGKFSDLSVKDIPKDVEVLRENWI